MSEFAVAPRRIRTEPTNEKKPSENVEPQMSINDVGSGSLMDEAHQDSKSNDTLGFKDEGEGTLISSDKNVQRMRSTTRALKQEASRLRLQDLKQRKSRESKHFVNCPLDYDTKQRLARASTENDVKMTDIMKAAIKQFLTDSGY